MSISALFLVRLFFIHSWSLDQDLVVQDTVTLPQVFIILRNYLRGGTGSFFSLYVLVTVGSILTEVGSFVRAKERPQVHFASG